MIKLKCETEAQIDQKNQEIDTLNGYLDKYRSDIRHLEEHIAK